jgi:glucose-1-phosphate thymidylyltransferase
MSNKPIKAIIPVAGIGTRLRPHTHTVPKSLIPVAGKPILGHIMDKLTDAGVSEFIIVIGYLGDKIEEFVTQNYPNVDAKFVIQTVGKGVGHAIYLTKEHWTANDELLVVFGDTIVEVDLDTFLKSETNNLGVMKVEDPRQFGVAEIDGDRKITRMVEKPTMPKSNLALVGLNFIKNSGLFLDCLNEIIDQEIKTQNEYHLTDALMRMIDKGSTFTITEVDNWFDCGKKEIILETNKTLLEHNHYQKHRNKDNIHNSIIVEPVYIAADAVIKNSIIGPHVSIGQGAIVENSIMNDSIIGPNSHIQFVVLQDSLIGNDASLKGFMQSLNLGDSAEVNFG